MESESEVVNTSKGITDGVKRFCGEGLSLKKLKVGKEKGQQSESFKGDGAKK